MEDTREKYEIDAAVTLLTENGFTVIEITEAMKIRMNKCSESENGLDCVGCCCCVCILND